MARRPTLKSNRKQPSQPSKPHPPPDVPPPAAPPRSLLLAWSVLAGLVLIGYWNVVRLGFSNDDFLILEEVALRPVNGMLAWSHLIAGWWRPWSREFHFWSVYRLFEFNAAAFHLANMVLWLAVLACLLVLVRRLTDARTAVLVVAGAFTASAWGIYITWASCAQDLWMLLFGTLFLMAQLAGRRVLAPIALAMAMLSKETALLMVPIGAWMQFTLRGRAGLRARDWLAPMLVVLVWAGVHPSLGGRWFSGSSARFLAQPSAPVSASVLRYLFAPLNLEHWPGPRDGWAKALAEGAIWAAAIGALGWSMLRSVPAKGAAFPHRRRWIQLGLGWWAIGWSPFVVSVFQWHSYYGWFGICGAWLAAVACLSTRPRILLALLMMVSALRPVALHTYADEWGTEIHQRLASGRTERIHDQLLAFHPTLPHHARIFIAGVPSGTGLLTSSRYSAAVHVWYRDTTVALAGLSKFWTRSAAEPPGPDYFYVLDRDIRLFPVATGPLTVPDSMRTSSEWQGTEEQVAALLAGSGDWRRARESFARLAHAYPDTARYAFDLGVAYDSLGAAARATIWLDRADSLVGAPPSRGRGFFGR